VQTKRDQAYWIHCTSDITFALGASLIWALAYNLPFWQRTFTAMWHPTAGAVLFIASLFVLVLCVHAILLLLTPTPVLMRGVASALFIVAAASSYFCGAYGAIMNKDMLRNLLETDLAEVAGLLNFAIVTHVLAFGVIPAILVWRVALSAKPWRIRLKQRVVFIAASLTLCVAGLFACSADYAVFLRENKPIRFTLSPVAPISSLASVITAHAHGADRNEPLLDPAGNVQHVAPPHAKPLVLFLVIGETARAANFQLGGYSRPTNPHLQKTDGLVYFDNVASCGTSTVISVPCIFSHLGRARFDVDEAHRYTNLLDTLVKASFDVEWRDNNAGCKGVCARVAQIDYAARPDSQLCPESYCYDEVMLTDLRERLETLRRDTVITFHQIGSHGPAYAQRYPPQAGVFTPACRSNELQHCTPKEIVNAYDNTIAYTDYVLSKQIALLRAAADHVDGLLLYASDHGESLGEQGVYLHGLPYGFAPRVQKQVPMLLWATPGYLERSRLQLACLRSRAHQPFSHDNLYHTVLGATQVRNQLYDATLDILAACRVGEPVDHE
jgi:lipid A ethanolaminephosphotransferase